MGSGLGKLSPSAGSSPPSLPPTPSRNPKKDEESTKAGGEEEGQMRIEEQPKILPHEADGLSDCTLKSHFSSTHFLNQDKKDDKSRPTILILPSKELEITWGDDPRYWRWFLEREPRRGTYKEVVELVNVCWLEIHGRFEVSHLAPNMIYEVAFLLKMKSSAYGWWAPVNLKLVDAEGNVQWRRENLADKPKEESLELKGGELRIEAGSKGKAQVSLFEFEDGAWKSGLILEGVKICPKS